MASETIAKKVPGDIRKYKAKIFGNLTLRKIVSFGITVTADFLFYVLYMKPNALSVYDCEFKLLLLNCLCMSFYIDSFIYDMPLEIFVYTSIKNLVSPSKRLIKRREICRKKKFKRKSFLKQRKFLKNHPEYIPY